MAFHIGDPVFTNAGKPGVVRSTDNVKEEMTIDTDESSVAEQFRHGYLRGMAPEVRQGFNELMDEVDATPADAEKMDILQKKIAEYENHQSEGKRRMAKYLKAELMHIMNSGGTTPRYYQIPLNRAP